MISLEPDYNKLLALCLFFAVSQAYQEVPEWLEQVAEEAVGSSYGPAGGKFASRDRREVIMFLLHCDDDDKNPLSVLQSNLLLLMPPPPQWPKV